LRYSAGIPNVVFIPAVTQFQKDNDYCNIGASPTTTAAATGWQGK
jgi:hypothetical protein